MGLFISMKRFNFEFLFSGTNAALFGGFVSFFLLFLAIQPIQKRAVSTTLELLHVSFDPTREVIHEINEAFALDWQKFKGGNVQIFQSHGGSGSQARSIADGLPADVASFALFTDMEAIAKKKLLHAGWEKTKGVVSPPWATAIVFLVRKGNPKKIMDWNDLGQPGVGIITPNPKISGNGRLVFLSAWGYMLEKGRSESEAREFLKNIYKNVPVMDGSARASQVTFFQKKIGDVQLSFESEALMAVKESEGQLDIVYPSISIKVEPPIAVVDANVDSKGTRDLAEIYLNFYYGSEAQRIIAKNGYRPSDPLIAKEFESKFPPMKLFDLSVVGNSWAEVQSVFFAEDGIFDQVFKAIRNEGKR